MKEEWTKHLSDGRDVTYGYECTPDGPCIAHARVDPPGMTYTESPAAAGLSHDELEELFRGRF